MTLGGGVVAQAENPTWAPETAAALERIVGGHNAAVDGVDLGPAGGLVRDQRVTPTVMATDGSVARFSFRTAPRLASSTSGRVNATTPPFTCSPTPRPSSVSPTPPDRTAAFEAAVRGGDVRIEGVGPLNRAAWALVGLALWALVSPLQAVAVEAVVLLGAGAPVVAGTNAVGGGAVAAGSAGATSTSGAGVGTKGVSGAGVSGSAGATTGSSATGPSADSATEPATGALAGTGGNTMTSGSRFDSVGMLHNTPRARTAPRRAKRVAGRRPNGATRGRSAFPHVFARERSD